MKQVSAPIDQSERLMEKAACLWTSGRKGGFSKAIFHASISAPKILEGSTAPIGFCEAPALIIAPIIGSMASSADTDGDLPADNIGVYVWMPVLSVWVYDRLCRRQCVDV